MKKTFAAAILIAAVTLTGCNGETSSTPSEIIVAGGNTAEAEPGLFPVKLPDGTEIKSEPERIASLSPAATETTRRGFRRSRRAAAKIRISTS